MQPDIELTELTDIEVVRQDAVKSPASGFPVLVMKSAQAKTPETKEPVVADPIPAVQKDAAPEGGATPETSPATVPAETASEPQAPLADQIEKAVAEATRAATERIEALAAEVAKMRSTPIPGGPVLTAPAAVRQAKEQGDLIAKALYHERQAETVSDRELARFHRERAADCRKQAGSPS